MSLRVTFGALAVLVPGVLAAQELPLNQPVPLTPFSAQPVLGTIGVNQQVRGDLSLNPATYQGKPIQLWGFNCNAGQLFQMDILSDWDNYAIVFDPSGNNVAHDDDSGEGHNARITYSCRASGQYRLGITTYRTGVAAAGYTLQVQTVTLPSAIGAINANQQVLGNLALGSGSYMGKTIQNWTFNCSAGQTFQMDIESDWDNYAYLFDPTGAEVAHDDDSGGNHNARITHTCAMSGAYRLGVSAFGGGTNVSQYTLYVRSAPAQSQPGGRQPALNQPIPIQPPSLPAPLGVLAMNQQVNGDLTAGGGRYHGKTIQIWTLSCSAGQTIQMDITSSWDNYAFLFDPDGNEVAHDDDSGGNNNARIVHTCTQTGPYKLGVSVYSSGTNFGPYTLMVQPAGPR